MTWRHDVCPGCGGLKIEAARCCARCLAAERAARRSPQVCPFCHNSRPGYRRRQRHPIATWCCARAAAAAQGAAG